jgi:hypothetical protein
MELEDAEIGALAPPSLTLPRKGGGKFQWPLPFFPRSLDGGGPGWG